MTGTEVTISNILTDVGSIFESAIGWMGQALDAVVESPVLFIAVVGLPICGLGIGFLKRLLYV